MKRLYSILLVMAIISSFFTFTGCKKEEKGVDGERKTITFLRGGNLMDADKAAIEAMKEKYGVTVEEIICQYDEEQQKIVTSIAANDAIDVAALSVNCFPLFAKQQWVLPLEEYVDLEREDMGKSVMETMFSYKDNVYCAASLKSVSPYVLYYNKQLFEQEGLPDPLTYYKEGKWNWDTFKAICSVFTRDTDGDGVIDRWGYAGWYRDSFYGLNHCAPVALDDNGNYVLNLNDAKVIRSLEMMRDMWYVYKYAGIEGDSIYDSFYAGKNAFLNEYTWAEKNIIKAKADGICDFEYGVVPAPYGPDNTEQYNLVHAGGFSIINGSKSPKTAGKFVEELISAHDAQAIIDEQDKPAENIALYDELRQKGYTDRLYDGVISNANDLNSDVIAGVDIQSAISEWSPIYQRKLEEANQDPEKPIVKDFQTIDLKFESDDQTLIVNPKKADEEGLSVSWVSGADAIEGNGSVRINVTPEVNDGDRIDAAITGTSVSVLPWHNYKITFSYKVEQVGGKYAIGIVDTTKKKYEMIEFTAENAGEIYTFESKYSAIGNNTDSLVFMFTCENAYPITIDNFKVEEVTA